VGSADADDRPHYAVKVTDLPPTEIVCKCGRVFDGADPIGQIAAHMETLNPAGGGDG
jgi:hypothetical protein